MDIGRKIIGGRARHVIDETRPDENAESAHVKRYSSADKVDSGDCILTAADCADFLCGDEGG